MLFLGLPFIMPVWDILTAFDLMQHKVIGDALTATGICATGLRMELRELTDVSMTLQLPNTPLSGPVPLQKAGIQGGVCTPDQFNAVMEHALYKPVQWWQERKWGIILDDGHRLTHLVWCDNIFLFETDVVRASIMMRMVTETLSEHSLFWKPSSLQVLCAGRLAEAEPVIAADTLEGPCKLTVVRDMLVLGTKVDNLGTASAGPDHRFALATKSFWSLKKNVVSGVSIKVKMDALARIPSSVLAFDAGNWIIDKDVLIRAKRWEYSNVRLACRLRWKDDKEGRMQYMKRTANLIEKWFLEYRINPLHVRLLKTYFKTAWREIQPVNDSGEPLLLWARSVRSRDRWDASVAAFSLRERRLQGLAHARPGRVAIWDDLIVRYLGHGWRELPRQHSETSWMTMCYPVMNAICEDLRYHSHGKPD